MGRLQRVWLVLCAALALAATAAVATTGLRSSVTRSAHMALSRVHSEAHAQARSHSTHRLEVGATCAPACRYVCQKGSECPATCKPICKPPNCKVTCAGLGPSVCQVNCENARCQIECKDEFHCTGECPKCVNVCEEPKCEVQCQNPQPQCKPVCEDPYCEWECQKPAECPIPKCKLQCDPVGSCHHDCCPCSDPSNAMAALQIASAVYATPRHSEHHREHNREELPPSHMLPSATDVMHEARFLQLRARSGVDVKEMCCPCAASSAPPSSAGPASPSDASGTGEVEMQATSLQ